MKVRIEPASPEHASELLAFEVSNRRFFEEWIAGRGDAYYKLDRVLRSLQKADEDRRADRAYSYLVRAEGILVGRVNLRAVERPLFERATLGYRIGQQYGGRGYATEAVRLALAEAFEALGLWRVEALVTEENAASRSVLSRNGFLEFGRARRSICLKGQWRDLLYFECHSRAAVEPPLYLGGRPGGGLSAPRVR